MVTGTLGNLPIEISRCVLDLLSAHPGAGDSSDLPTIVLQLSVCKSWRGKAEDWLRLHQPFASLALGDINYCALPHIRSIQLGGTRPSGKLAGERARAAGRLLTVLPSLEKLELLNVDSERSGLMLLPAIGSVSSLRELWLEMHGDLDTDAWADELARAQQLQRLAVVGDTLLTGIPLRSLVEDLPYLQNLVMGSGCFENLKTFFTLAHMNLELMVLRDVDFGTQGAALWSCFASCPSLKLLRIEHCQAQVSFRFRIKFSASLMISSRGKKVINDEKVRLRVRKRWTSDTRCDLFLKKVLNYYEQDIPSTPSPFPRKPRMTGEVVEVQY